MKYPCGIIKDLLPLYIDNIVNEESRAAVENHLAECEDCKKQYEIMKTTDCFTEKNYDNSEDLKMADSLKKIKNKINRKLRNVIIGSAAAITVLIFAYNLLFVMPIRNIDISDVSVTAVTHNMYEIASAGGFDSDSVRISMDENDNSDEYKLDIPSMPNVDISVSENTIEKNGNVSIVTWSSPYFIKEIHFCSDITDDNTIYVEAFKTTVLNNKAKDVAETASIEFKDIDKIVFVDNGQETVLWSK